MNWNEYLTRIDGKLACMPTLDQVPVCETCGGKARRMYTRSSELCPACRGTGRAWYWQIQPMAGMLVALTAYIPVTRIEPQHAEILPPGTWRYISAEWDINSIRLLAEHGSILPLLPPADLPGTTPAELLALLPGSAFPDETYGAIPLAGPFWSVYTDIETLALNVSTAFGIDPAAAKLAIQRHEAIEAWLKGAEHGTE